jgi:hypothetical protein
MNLQMNQKVKIIVLAAIVTVALLAIYWASTSGRLPGVERLGWERWDLTREQRIEIEQLIEDMKENGTGGERIRVAIGAKLDEWGVKPPPPGDIELFYTVKTAFSSINTALLICLLVIYVDIYRKTKSEFTIGLLIFSMVLLFYALSSNPLVHSTFGFRALGLGPFAMLPDLFTFIALIILLYLTLK